MDYFPMIEKRENEGVSMLTREFDEFGELITVRTHLSITTAKRLLSELNLAIENIET